MSKDAKEKGRLAAVATVGTLVRAAKESGDPEQFFRGYFGLSLGVAPALIGLPATAQLMSDLAAVAVRAAHGGGIVHAEEITLGKGDAVVSRVKTTVRV